MLLNLCQTLFDSIFDSLIIENLLSRIDKSDIQMFALLGQHLAQLALIQAERLADAAFEQISAPRPLVVLLRHRDQN